MTASPRSSSPAASSRIAICSALSRCTGRGFESFRRRRLPTAGLLGMRPWSTATARICVSRSMCMLIERARQRSRVAAVASAQPVDVAHRQRRPVLGGRCDLSSFAHLALAVAVDLGHGDLGDVVVLEERQQVVGEVVPVAAGGVLLDLELLGREPIGRELVKGRVGVLRRRGIGPRRPPRAEVDIAKHDRELALRHRQSPAVLGLAQGQVLALAIGAKPQREAGLAWCRPDHLSSCGACHRLPDPFARLPTSMQATFARGVGVGVGGGLADCAISRLLH